jgi:hypothetical protein
MQLTHCTLTGVDERTDLQRLIELSKVHPIAEWGFLYSPKQQGTPGRYPSVPFLRRALSGLPHDVKVAVHVCGAGVADLMAGEPTVTELVWFVLMRAGRLQLNFNQRRKPVDLEQLRKCIAKWTVAADSANFAVITQHNSANEDLWKVVSPGLTGYAVLFDASGGLGKLASEWPAPLPVACGYAGGLGPRNIEDELGRIAQVAGERRVWVDMESSLRTTDEAGHDWFSLERCEQVLHPADAWTC